MTPIRTCSVLFIFSALLACSSARYHREQVAAEESGKVTVGTVQRQIKVGMSGADVATALGSPNIVSTDEQRREVWIYDKISTEVAYSHDSGGVVGLVFGGWAVGDGVLGGAPAAGYSSGSGAASKTQKTFTVIVKFDKDSRVRDFAYHSSTF